MNTCPPVAGIIYFCMTPEKAGGEYDSRTKLHTCPPVKDDRVLCADNEWTVNWPSIGSFGSGGLCPQFTVVSRHSCRGHRTSGVWVVVSLFVPRVQLPLSPLVSGPTMRDAAQAPVACLGFWTRGEAFSTVLVSLAFNQLPLNMFNNLLLQVFLRWPSQRSGFAWSPTSLLRLPARP
jgi:hypothetical protein